MKKSIPLLMTSIFLAIVLMSCESHEQKADDAFENVKNEKMKLKDSAGMVEETIQDSVKTMVQKKNESTDEWTQFKADTERKILANELKIKKIKGIANINAKVLKQVASLEQDNNDLRNQMNVYKEEVKVMWESFKTKMNHDVNEIEIELKDLTVNNKK